METHPGTGPFYLDWPTEDLESVRRTIITKYNAENHSQSAREAALDIRRLEVF